MLASCNTVSIDRIDNQRSIREVTHWCVNFHFEALNLYFGRRRLVFLEPENTICGKEGGAELISS